MSDGRTRSEFLRRSGVALCVSGLATGTLAQDIGNATTGDATNVDATTGDATTVDATTVDATNGGKQEPFPFELMICDYVRFKLSRVNKYGEVVWEHSPAGKVWDFVLLDEDTIVYPIITDTMEVRCIDFQKKLKWAWPYANQYREIINITRHQSQLIISGQSPPQAIVMSLDGTIQKQLPIPAKYQHHHGQLGNVYAVGDNHFLAQLWGEGTVLEVDGSGKEVWRYQVPKFGSGRYPVGTVQDVLRLDNGNTMIACGDSKRNPMLIEVDKDNKVVWSLSNEDMKGKGLGEKPLKFLTGFHILPNGNVVFTNWCGHGQLGKAPQLFEVTREKKIVWTFQDDKTMKTHSSVQVLDVPGDAIKGTIEH